MRSDLAIAQVRLDCFMGDEAAAPEFTDARILTELTDKCRGLFGDPIIKAASGYWRKAQRFQTTAGKSRYRNPPRALNGGLIGLELQTPERWVPLVNNDPRDLPFYSRAGTPARYFHDGDTVQLWPIPDGVYALRFIFYISPSSIVRSQCSTQGGDQQDRGRIVAVDPQSRTIDCNVLPYDQLLAAPVPISLEGGQRIDVVSPTGWHEPVVFSLPVINISGGQLTVGGLDSLEDVQVGDYVRAELQTDWAPLPAEGQRILVDATARKILPTWLDDQQKAAAIEQASVGDLARFFNSLEPRVQTQPKTIPIYLRRR